MLIRTVVLHDSCVIVDETIDWDRIPHSFITLAVPPYLRVANVTDSNRTTIPHVDNGPQPAQLMAYNLRDEL